MDSKRLYYHELFNEFINRMLYSFTDKLIFELAGQDVNSEKYKNEFAELINKVQLVTEEKRVAEYLMDLEKYMYNTEYTHAYEVGNDIATHIAIFIKQNIDLKQSEPSKEVVTEKSQIELKEPIDINEFLKAWIIKIENFIPRFKSVLSTVQNAIERYMEKNLQLNTQQEKEYDIKIKGLLLDISKTISYLDLFKRNTVSISKSENIELASICKKLEKEYISFLKDYILPIHDSISEIYNPNNQIRSSTATLSNIIITARTIYVTINNNLNGENIKMLTMEDLEVYPDCYEYKTTSRLKQPTTIHKTGFVFFDPYTKELKIIRKAELR